MSNFIARGCYLSKSLLLEKGSSIFKPSDFVCSSQKHNGRVIVSLVWGYRHYRSMSSSDYVNSNNSNGNENTKPSKSVPKRKYSAILRSNTKRKRTLSHSEILEETDPLTTSEKETLLKWKNILAKTKHYYEAIFVLGPMCSGKTKTIHEFKCSNEYKKFAYIDTDEIMEGLNGYDHKKVDIFYPSARKVSIHLTDWLLDERMSFIAEGTCVLYDELEDYIVRLKEKGYDIKVMKIDDVALDVVVDRSEKRFRYVAPEVIKDIYINSQIGLKKLWEKNEDNFLFKEFLQ